MRTPAAFFSAALLALAPGLSARALTLIHAGTLIDGVSDTPRHQVTIAVDGERIASIADGFTAAGAGDTVIDLSSATVTPGWIDCHVHLDLATTPHSFTDEAMMNPADYAIFAVSNARKTLLAGFTTVRNLGDHFNSTIALRKAIQKGIVIGPRIYTAGAPIGSTGGHADPTNGYSAEVMDLLRRKGVIHGPDEAREAVRQHYKDGADLIKIMASGGVLSMEASGDAPQLDEDEIRAVVATAHEYGMKVAVHAHGAEAIRRSVVGGVDSIEHGTYMNDEDIALMKEHGTYYVPTLTAGRWVADKAKAPGFFPELVRKKAATIGPVLDGTFHRAYLAGIKIAFGTDTGVSAHGENAQEFQYMVADGMPPMAAIQAATREAARLIGAEKDLGTVEPGKYADLTAVPGDVLADISLVRHVSFVMKGGTVYVP
jgi:imidazolonepropionase-like amidohydrolase